MNRSHVKGLPIKILYNRSDKSDKKYLKKYVNYKLSSGSSSYSSSSSSSSSSFSGGGGSSSGGGASGSW